MVRILAGTLVYIGQGKLEESAVARALMSGDRLLLGPTAPAHGLCLNWVRYDHSAC
jgi:tRNA pseudouridine38-40 synthase